MRSVWRLIKFTKKYSYLLILTGIAILGVTAVNLFVPWCIRDVTRILTETASEQTAGAISGVLEQIFGIAFSLGIAYVIKMLLRFCQSYLSHVASWNVVAQLRTMVYAHLQKLSLSYYSDKQTGQLMSRVMNDTALLEQMVAHSIPDVASNIFVLVGVVVLLMLINWQLALLVMIPIPLIFILTYWFSTRVRPYFRKAQQDIADLNAALQDNLSGIREIQAFNQQVPERDKIEGKAKKHAKSILHALRLSAVFHPSVEFCASVGTVIVIAVGGSLAVQGAMSAADVVGFIAYLTMFYAPIEVLARVAEEFQQAVAGSERIFEVLDTEPDIVDKPGARKLRECKGDIAFKNVCFSYDENTPILDRVSFEVKAGQMLAIVGPTGVGKSTTINLLARFYEPDSGEILVDGENISDLTIASLRDHMSIVLQDVFLFNGTIAENIAYGFKNATPEQIVEAAKIARIHDYIEELPEGYNTTIGERGVRLSGGQKQRISIARAVLRNAEILVLDEATAAVDMETEAEIQAAIQNLVGTRTVIVIAHRLSTVRRADRIIVLSDGVIAESGTHEELLEKNGLYSSLCKSNLK